MKLLSAVILLLAALMGSAQQIRQPERSISWRIDNLKKIGGHRVEVIGDPNVVKTEKGKAIVFDGFDDGIFVGNDPIAGADQFTIEALFRPDAGGGSEQRWLHIEDSENTETRALLEIRLDGNEWFLDTFIKSGENRSPLFADKFRHPVGKWFYVALVYDGNEMRHYVNGQFEISGKIMAKPFGKGITSIGVRQNKVYWFKGAVAKARFTNRALLPDKFMK